jgi:AcrR family transcriptional regulator
MLQRPGVAEVTAEAGMAKGTVYLYFRSLAALFLAHRDVVGPNA